MRRVVVLVVALLATLAPGWAAPAAAQTDPASAEQQFVEAINGLRSSKGLGRLEVHAELVGVGRAWAAEMAKVDQISHNPRLANAVRADWQKLGENVGVGMTVDKLHRAFIDSPTHYRNLVDPAFTHIGVGVVLGRDGAIFTAHQFMQLRPAKAAAPAPKPEPVPAPEVETKAEELVAPPAPLVVAAAVAPARLVLVLEQLRALDGRT